MSAVSGSDSVGCLEEEARKRKERLASLKRKAEGNPTEAETEAAAAVLPKPSFRSYNPNDDSLKELKISQGLPQTVEEQVKDEVKSGQHEELVEEIDLANLAPRKIDWDLKRNIQKKVDKLEKRTQRAIAELIRDRIKSTVEEDMQQ